MEIEEIFIVNMERIEHIPGGLNYGAQVEVLFVTKNGKREIIFHDFGMVMSKTAAGARAEMTATVESWVESQRKTSGMADR